MAPLEETRAQPQSAEAPSILRRKAPSLSTAWAAEPGADDEVDHDTRFGAILDRLQEQVFKRRIRVKDVFRDFDKLNCSRITREQFVRALRGLCPGLDQTEVDLVVNHFKCQPGRRVTWPQVYNYIAFCNCIEEVFGPRNLEDKPHSKVWVPGSLLAYKNGGTQPKMDDEEETHFWDVLHRVVVLSQTRGVDLHMAFMDGTRPTNAAVQVPRGSGKILESGFRHKFPFPGQFSEEDMQLLLTRYRVFHPEAIQVSKMLKDMDDMLEEKERRYRLGVGARPGDSRSLSKSSSAAEITGDAEQPSQLGRNASDSALQERPVPQRPSSAVASRRTQDREKASVPQSMSRPRSALLTRSGARFEVPQVDIMTKLRQLCRERRLRFDGAFGDFDKLKKGLCSEGHFKTAMTIMRIDFSGEECTALCGLYRGDGGKIRYRDFLAALEGPQALQAEAQARNATGRYKAMLNADETTKVENVKGMLARRVQLRRMEIESCFHDFWKRSGTSTAGHVTASLVGRIMTVLGFHLTDEDVQLLCKAYCDTADGQGFNYLSFCADVDPRPEDARPTKNSAVSGRLWSNRYFDERGRTTPSIHRPASAPFGRLAPAGRLLRA